GLRNASRTQTLDLPDINGRFVCEDNLIQIRYSDNKKTLITTPSSSAISTVFFSNKVIKDFQENYDDEVDERSMNNFSSVSKGFQPKFTPKLIQSSPNSNSQTNLKFQKDYKAEYKKIKAKLALLEASPLSPQNPKTLQPKNKGLVVEIFDWNKEEVFDNEEVTRVKVLMALADDELTVGKSHVRNGEWVDITIRKVNTLLSMDEDADWQNYLKDELLSLKQAKLDAVTFQIQNTELTKLNHALQEELKEEKKINEKWLTRSKIVSQCSSEQIPHQKKKVLGGELLTESLSKININENAFIPASMRILVPETQGVNESLETLNTPESSKDSEANFVTPLPPLKNLQGASPSSEVMPLTFQPHSPKERPGLCIMKHTKPETHDSSNKSVSETITVSETKQIIPSVPTEVKDTEQESKLNELTKLVQMLTDEKILKAKAKPFSPCTHCGFNDHKHDDCRNYPECVIYGSYDHSTLVHNRVNHIRGGVLAESSQSNESSIGVKCNTYGSTVHFTSDHNKFDHFKRGEKIQAAKAREPTKKCSRSMIGVKSYLHKYVEQPCPKVVFDDNSSCITEGYGSINCEESKLGSNSDPFCLYKHDPRDPHFIALKRILRYVRGTLDYGLQLHVSSTTQLSAYTDVDWAGMLLVGPHSAEYRGVANVVAETAWIRNLLCELHTPLFTATLVYCDNVSVVYMSANPVQHQRTKHIEIDIHFVRDFVASGQVRVLHVPSRFQYADIFTKGLPTALFIEFRSSLNVRRSPAHTEGE
nr:retrovirus-related Pol polyprotein from transposon TNT 1-94 [Tanacetum cinerariifolium]